MNEEEKKAQRILALERRRDKLKQELEEIKHELAILKEVSNI